VDRVSKKSMQDDAGKTDFVINKPDPVDVHKYLMGKCKFSVVPSDRTRDNGHRLKYFSQEAAKKEDCYLGVNS